MKLVAFETSGRDGSVAALASDDGRADLAWNLPLPAGRRSAQTLAPALRDLLDQTGWSGPDIDVVAVASGPGSFTGLRVGVTAAKMLAYAKGARVVEVNTLAVIAGQANPGLAGPVWAIIDAQRGELFAARFDSPAADVDQGVELLGVREWLAKLRPGEAVSGPVLSRLTDQLPEGVIVTDPSVWAPRALTVAELALPRALAGETAAPASLLPRYHRLSAAEEKRLKTERSP